VNLRRFPRNIKEASEVVCSVYEDTELHIGSDRSRRTVLVFFRQ
jgi:hypothetical protein